MLDCLRARQALINNGLPGNCRRVSSLEMRTLGPRYSHNCSFERLRTPPGASSGVSPSLAFRPSDPGTLCAVPPLSLSTGCCRERPMSRLVEPAARDGQPVAGVPNRKIAPRDREHALGGDTLDALSRQTGMDRKISSKG
jgi:hypothetical protein